MQPSLKEQQLFCLRLGKPSAFHTLLKTREEIEGAPGRFHRGFGIDLRVGVPRKGW